jgi:hypothetical protein
LCGGVDFLKRINEDILHDETVALNELPS